MKNIIIALIALLVLGGGYYLYSKSANQNYQAPNIPDTNMPKATNPSSGNSTTTAATSSTSTSAASVPGPVETIGKSVDGNPIVAYHFGTGPKEILFIGGIHGGYEWNSALVAFQMVDYLQKNPNIVPAGETITVIPDLNPDGQKQITGTVGAFTAADVTGTAAEQEAARFNANNVDLNRNFDCNWAPTGTWQSKTVSGGSAAFSEPESTAIKNYIAAHKPTAAVVWYSAAGGVYASSCNAPVSTATTNLLNVFATASGYPAHQSFDSYPLTGDMVNWFAKEGIPAISVLLTNHTDIEWDKNQKGIDAVIQNYAN